jgi:hypothetical protein
MTDDKFTLEIDGLRIVEWLSSRNKLPKLWEKNYKGSQLALTTLCEKLDKTFLPNLDEEEKTYYDIDQICENLLSSEEGKQKNILGWYQSKLLNDWLNLRELYKKNNFHIVSLAKYINNNF